MAKDEKENISVIFGEEFDIESDREFEKLIYEVNKTIQLGEDTIGDLKKCNMELAISYIEMVNDKLVKKELLDPDEDKHEGVLVYAETVEKIINAIKENSEYNKICFLLYTGKQQRGGKHHTPMYYERMDDKNYFVILDSFGQSINSEELLMSNLDNTTIFISPFKRQVFKDGCIEDGISVLKKLAFAEKGLIDFCKNNSKSFVNPSVRLLISLPVSIVAGNIERWDTMRTFYTEQPEKFAEKYKNGTVMDRIIRKGNLRSTNTTWKEIISDNDSTQDKKYDFRSCSFKDRINKYESRYSLSAY